MVWRKGNPVALLVGLQISVQLLSCVQLFVTLWTAAHQASLSITNSRSLLKLMSIESMMPSNHLILIIPFSSHLQTFPATGSFLNELVLLIKWPKYWSFSFNISSSNEHSGLISLGWIGWISLQSKGPSRVFSTLQFKSINFSVLSFLHSPTLTSICDHWKNYSLD